MTQEEKAKAYDEAIERVVNIRTGKCETTFIFTKGLFNYLFPELEECNEEEVREAMIDFFKHEREEGVVVSHYGVNIERMIAWLEKQGNPTDINPSEFDLRLNTLLKQFESLPKEELVSSLSFYLNVVQNDGTYREEKQGEQNLNMAKSPQLGEQEPANKVAPEFHEGDQVVYHGWTTRILKVTHDGYVNDKQGFIPKEREDCMRLWDIAKDAKNGDLIYVSTKVKGIQAIFHKFENGIIYFHCNLCGDFTQGGYEQFDGVEFVSPLQKTQYQSFFQKMKEAGYEWDAEKRELKKISQRMISAEAKEAMYGKPTAWSEEDENEVAILESYIRSGEWSESHIDRALGIVDELVNKCKSLKGRVQPKQEWSDEDETVVKDICDKLNRLSMIVDNQSIACQKDIDWIKTLKQRIGG